MSNRHPINQYYVLQQYLYAMRFLVRHKGYSGINIPGLTLGFCACLALE